MAGMDRPLRDYQMRIYVESCDSNALVVLPTGSGKTRIAAQHIIRVCQDHHSKVLFLVPTRLLVDQQAASLIQDTGLEVVMFRGGSQLPSNSASVLVSTPEAYLALAKRSNSQFDLGTFALVIFDEVHHVSKDHPYSRVAKKLTNLAGSGQGHPIQVLGLTASMTYAMGKNKIESDIDRLLHDLRIEKVLTASIEELQAGGYHASQVSAQVISLQHTPSAQPKTLSCELDNSVQDLLFTVGCSNSDLHPLLPTLIATVLALQDAAVAADPSFESPIGETKVGEWGKYAFRKWEEARMEFRLADYGNSQDCGSLGRRAAQLETLFHLYEALSWVINSQHAALELAMRYLEWMGVVTPASCATARGQRETDVHTVQRDGGGDRVGSSNQFSKTCICSTHALTATTNDEEEASAAAADADSAVAALQQAWHIHSPHFSRLRQLADELAKLQAQYGDKLRVIVFAQQRLTTHVLQYYMSRCSPLASLASAVLYATSSPATSQLSVNPTQSAERLAQFAAGEVQVLFATAAAEEGIDIKQANCVVRFDAVQNPVSFVQGRGRARQEDSRFLVLSEMDRKGVGKLREAEEQQREFLNSLAEQGVSMGSLSLDSAADLSGKHPTHTPATGFGSSRKGSSNSLASAFRAMESAETCRRREAAAQLAREAAGRKAAQAAIDTAQGSVQALYLYVFNAGGSEEAEYVANSTVRTDMGWTCNLVYTPNKNPGEGVAISSAPVLRARGSAMKKQGAREAAAKTLLQKLLAIKSGTLAHEP